MMSQDTEWPEPTIRRFRPFVMCGWGRVVGLRPGDGAELSNPGWAGRRRRLRARHWRQPPARRPRGHDHRHRGRTPARDQPGAGQPPPPLARQVRVHRASHGRRRSRPVLAGHLDLDGHEVRAS
ncbi:hypothetical protein APR03_000031 [Promicromonospora thailandica]|uniref:Uncharacterized protein n=1 Tax=Promicromonospora thailandica TaxID=765201 RepID=A0A9X2FZR5_9MICO|nr:hypothetical protein [Promicromonospora thailandica]